MMIQIKSKLSDNLDDLESRLGYFIAIFITKKQLSVAGSNCVPFYRWHICKKVSATTVRATAAAATVITTVKRLAL